MVGSFFPSLQFLLSHPFLDRFFNIQFCPARRYTGSFRLKPLVQRADSGLSRFKMSAPIKPFRIEDLLAIAYEKEPSVRM